MSDRGSFVTEWIYCKECRAAANKVLIKDHGHVGICFGIIAGHISETYSGGEFDLVNEICTSELSPLICHPIRIAVLGEDGSHILTVWPKGKK
jgi:hypothetical protein